MPLAIDARNTDVSRSPSESQGGRRRVQLDFTPAAFERLEKLQTAAGVDSKAEVIRNAVRLYEWYLLQVQEGYTLAVAKDDTYHEVELLF